MPLQPVKVSLVTVGPNVPEDKSKRQDRRVESWRGWDVGRESTGPLRPLDCPPEPLQVSRT
jgi:hypothetical protein